MFKFQGEPDPNPDEEPDLTGVVEKAIVKFPNGASYTGQWKDDQRHGYGVQIWIDGSKYEGNWKNNKARGKGKKANGDRSVYEGNWRDN